MPLVLISIAFQFKALSLKAETSVRKGGLHIRLLMVQSCSIKNAWGYEFEDRALE